MCRDMKRNHGEAGSATRVRCASLAYSSVGVYCSAAMRRIRLALHLLLAFALFVQSGTAAAQCLRALHGSGFAIEICTAEGGLRVVHLGTEEPGAPAEHAPGFCAACHALPHLALPAPPALAEPAAFAATPVIWPARTDPPARRARASPYAPRGPPIV